MLAIVPADRHDLARSGDGREQVRVGEKRDRRRRRRGGDGRRRRRGRREAIRDVWSTGQELGDRPWPAGQELRRAPPPISDDDPQGLAVRRSRGDEAHVGSAFSILAGGRRTGRYDTVIAAVNRPPEPHPMPFHPAARVSLGRTGLTVTRLGFGGASIGGLFTAVSDDDARATIRRAWDIGIRYFDTAPLYGYGASERRIGDALRAEPRDAFVLSTKVGRLVRAPGDVRPGDEIDRQRKGDTDDAFYVRAGAERLVFDYSRDGVRRSIAESLGRLGLDHIDIALIHDPDDHWQAALDGAYPALAKLRDEGVIRAVGAGMNQSEMLARFVRETDIDVVLVAGRYTILEQGALDELLPASEEHGVAVLVGGVMNSGVLANPSVTDSRFNYLPAPPAVVDRARRIGEVCERHGVPLRAAAVQFPLAHPAVVSLVSGVRNVAHLDEYPAFARLEIPAGLWQELRAEGLLRHDAPVPE
jgi:D-threo-aldose 1-dehydrogenase